MLRMKVEPAVADQSIPLVDKIELWAIDDSRLRIYDRNSRTHSDAQILEIAASYKAFGMNNPILWHPEIRITAGAGRFRAAKLAELKQIPVIRLDHLTEAQARAYLIADNKLPEHAGWDETILRDELRALEALGQDLAPIGFSEAELAVLLPEPESDDTEEPESEEKASHEPLKFDSDGTDRKFRIQNADCLEYLKTLPPDSIDSIVTDPPAGISFMGKEWDDDKGGRKQWTAWLADVMKQCRRVIKPGGHALVWAIPRTSHWTGNALEDAGWEIRDCVYHLFGSGFPKSHDVSKGIDKLAGAEREIVGYKKQGVRSMFDGGKPRPATLPATLPAKEWEGWGTALKPAAECWWLARKPLSEDTVAANVQKWGTGALNIDGGRIGLDVRFNPPTHKAATAATAAMGDFSNCKGEGSTVTGRWPANIVLSHDPKCILRAEGKRAEGKRVTTDMAGQVRERAQSVRYDGDVPDEYDCVDGCPVAELDRQSGQSGQFEGLMGGKQTGSFEFHSGIGGRSGKGIVGGVKDFGGASRFFYIAKPAGSEKHAGLGDAAEEGEPDANTHPTVKPVKLMQYLCRLITPPRGTILDAFAGSGTTGIGALAEGFNFIGIEQDPTNAKIARKRIRTAFPAAIDENKK